MAFGKEFVLCKEEELYLHNRKKRLVIGVPNERGKGENRVCLTPETVQVLVSMGHHVLLQREAGSGANYTDMEYSDAGASIVDTLEEVYCADVILKVTTVSLQDTKYMHEHQIVLSSLKLNDLRKDAVAEMMRKKVTAFGFDILKDESGCYPVVRIMSEIAGNISVMIAGEYLSGGKGVVLGGITGITPTEVVILGAGTLGEFAARTALGMGAVVKIFDPSLGRLRRIREKLGQAVYTSVMHEPVMNKVLRSADVVIGALRHFDSEERVVLTEEQVGLMKKGTVIVDLTVDHGGCIATSRPTTHQEPIYIYNGVVHYCVPNVLSKVPRTTSIAYSNVLLPVLKRVADSGGFIASLRIDAELRNGVYIYNGILTKEVIAEKFGLLSKDIDLLIAAF